MDRISTDSLAGRLGDFRNKRINGNLDIWQRGLAFTVPASGASYTADRVCVFNGTNQSMTVSRMEFSPVAGNLPGIKAAPRYFLRINFAVAPTTGAIYVFERIEDVRTLNDTIATGTWWVNPLGGACQVAQYIDINCGTGGSTQVNTPIVDTQVNPNPGAMQKFQHVMAIPTLAGKTIGPSSFLGHTIRLLPRSAGNYDFSHMSLVEGDATAEVDPFTPRTIAQELALCRYYFQAGRHHGIGVRDAGLANGQLRTAGTVLGSMRATPSMTYVVNSGFALGEGVQIFFPTASAATFERLNKEAFAFYGYVQSGTGTTVNVPWVVGFDYTADAEI